MITVFFRYIDFEIKNTKQQQKTTIILQVWKTLGWILFLSLLSCFQTSTWTNASCTAPSSSVLQELFPTIFRLICLLCIDALCTSLLYVQGGCPLFKIDFVLQQRPLTRKPNFCCSRPKKFQLLYEILSNCTTLKALEEWHFFHPCNIFRPTPQTKALCALLASQIWSLKYCSRSLVTYCSTGHVSYFMLCLCYFSYFMRASGPHSVCW